MADEEEVPRPYWVPTESQDRYGTHIPQGMASARQRVASSGQYVLFFDILGFADLVESDEEEHIRWAAGMNSLLVGMRDRPPSPLTILFQSFHGAIESALQGARNLNLKEPAPSRPPAIVFSDSAFIVMPWLNMSIDVATRLMRHLVVAGVPARMGIGFGGFSASRFSTETRLGGTHHVSEFFGTAVVRAHRAESCGVKGLQILLHPSVLTQIEESRVSKMSSYRTPPGLELTLHKAAKRHSVTHEINYLSGDKSDAHLSVAVEDMKKKASAEFIEYYDNTLLALKRMGQRKD